MTELPALQGQCGNPRQFHKSESAAFGKPGQFAPSAEADSAALPSEIRAP